MSGKKECYLVTGASGFIGSNLTRLLTDTGKDVHVFVRNPQKAWRLHGIISKIHIHQTDLTDPSLSKVIDKIRPNIIFHLAAFGALQKQNNVNDMIDVNIKGTLGLLTSLQKHKLIRFVHAGSSSEYGISGKSMKETDLIKPVNEYGVTKAAATLLCQQFAQRYSLPVVTLRLFSPYGYFEDESRLIPTVICRMLTNKKVRLSSPRHVRDFIFVQDVLDAFLQCVKVSTPPGEVINIGSGKQHSVRDVVNIVKHLTGSNSSVLYEDIPAQSRQVETNKWEADILKAKSMLQWSPKWNLQQGLSETVTWFRKNINVYHKTI
jgi:nucleoside-diphosphate-sugar epimerase